ncbi:MAG: ZIP family metal transporter [Planctomycetota bacterium]|jgi:zinc and cadmium transporter
MSPLLLLTVYCALVILASLAGGWLPIRIRLTHRRMELALSFVSGVILGVAVLHMLPHAVSQRADHDLGAVSGWMLAGFLAMFFIERFFCFHHHDAPGDDGARPACGHTLSWSGAAIGLTLHSLIAGIALAASVAAEPTNAAAAGLGTFLVIVLHKPFDALTIGALMAAGGWSRRARHVVNAAFSLAIPLGAALFHLGLGMPDEPGVVLSGALAFAAGTFLCIALSDLLPELQFHQHDRVKLSVALLLGLALAWGVSRLEETGHDHDHDPSPSPAASALDPDRPPAMLGWS